MFESAHWIGPEPEKRQGRGTESVFYRLRASLSQRPQTCTVHISAATRYRLHINGVAIHSGPQRSDGVWLYYDSIDIAPWLVAGENVIAVQVMQFQQKGTGDRLLAGPGWAMPGQTSPWLLVDGEPWLTTGVAPWQYCVDAATRFAPSPKTAHLGANEDVLGEAYPHGWTQAGEIAGFVQAQRMQSMQASPYGELWPYPVRPRSIPLLLEDAGEPLKELAGAKGGAAFSFGGGSVTLGPGKHVIELDAGMLRTGFPRFVMQGGAGSVLRFGYTECYYKADGSKGRRDDRSGEFGGIFDCYRPGGGRESYQPFLMRTFRYMRIEAEVGKEPITLYKPTYMLCNYPLDVRATVDSATEWVNPLWDISLQTLKNCMHETYEDCPYYEQLQYAMDTRLQVLFTFAISSDTALARQAVEAFHHSLLPEGILQARFPSRDTQVIPIFALHWIFMLEDLYEQTGELALLSRYQPTVDAVIGWFERKRGAYGLCEKLGYWEFADWTSQWNPRKGVPHAVDYGPCTPHNLTFALGLQSAARLAAAQGRLETAARFEQTAGEILGAVQRLCYNCEKGLYQDGPGLEIYSEHSQVFAVLAGLAQGKEAAALLRRMLKGELIRCSFPLKFYLFRAMEAAGLYEETLALWDDWQSLLPLHVTTWPEWPDAISAPRSECHAWGCLPLYEFVRSFLGIRPAGPGWHGIILRPRTAIAGEIEGQAPTPHGMVTVRIDRQEDGSMRAVGHAPQGVSLSVQAHDGQEIALYPLGGSFDVILSEK